MSEQHIEKAIRTAALSLEMEGFSVNEQAQQWCKKLLKNEITLEEYIVLAKQRVGILAE